MEIINNGTEIRYTSQPNFFGTDTFTYTVRDANNEEDTATVTVNVANINDLPDANNDVFTIDAGSPMQVLDVLANDNNLPDPPGEALTIFGVTPPVPAASGAVEVINNGTRIGFTPAAGFVGDVTFTYRVRDPGGAESDPAMVVIHVRNDNPTAGPDTGTVPEGSTENAIDVLANDTLATGANGPLMVIDVSATGSQGGTVAIGPGGANVLYTPAPNFFGTETFTYRVADGDGGEATGTVTMTVTDVADPALAVNDTFTVAENAAEADLDVLANDNQANADAPETYTITAVTQPANGTVEIADDDSSVLYQPNANFVGTDTFTYTIMDDDGTSSTATVNVTVTDVNQPPVAVDDVVNGVLEDQTTPVEIDVLANDTTNEVGETLEIDSFTQPATGGTVALNNDGTKLLFTPAANFNGQTTFTYVVSDGRGGTDTGMVTVNVTPVNDPPDAVDDAPTIAEDSGPLEIDVLANDIGGDVQLMNVTITTTQPGTGTVALTPDNRRIIFTPAANFFGTAQFQYTIDGGQGLTDTATVTVTVTAVNDFPPAAVADTITVTEDIETVLDILANDIAANPEGVGEPLTITRVGSGTTDNRTAPAGRW